MKMEAARELGIGCGLTTDAEHVNNAIRSFMMFLPYDKIPEEEAELIEDAKAHGVIFCDICGNAKMPDTDYCWGCTTNEKLAELARKREEKEKDEQARTDNPGTDN